MNLRSSISNLPKVGPIFEKKFEKIGVETIEDIFYHVPTRYLDYSNIAKVQDLKVGETATVHAKIVSLKNIYSKRGLKMQIGSVEDETGRITVLWFNQPFLVKTLYPGSFVSISGKVGFFSRKICFTSPDYELISSNDDETMHTGRLVPVYPETSGLSSKWIRRKIYDAFQISTINEFLPKEMLDKYELENFKRSIEMVHFPKDMREAEIGRKRLAFNELLNLELKSQIGKLNWQKNILTHRLIIKQKEISNFIDSLPFTLTGSQKEVVTEILSDLRRDIPMNRLLEGDVGSGKTIVAAIGIFASFINGFQSVIMAPTQILAIQHYHTLKKLFKKFNLRISLITSSTKEIELGRSDVFIGTHSLIGGKVDFNSVAFVVIDEQHKFGVEQRKQLIKSTTFSDKTKGTPHVLTMTATPIPRTVALTIYGDMDLSVISEMPKGRQKVTTWVVPELKRRGAYKWVNSQISKFKSQVFWVCPLIEDSKAETMQDVKSVTSEFLNLKSIFTDQRLGLLHGRMKADEKEKVLGDFKNHKLDILVTTPVVEVGIDIPNATIMAIEASERFGLAGLHQLRGRVGRGEKKSYCLLFTNFHSGKAYTRLKAMEATHSGFELSELDLKLRGPGEIFGTAQSGFPELKVASWGNLDLIKSAKEAAEKIIKKPKYFHLDSFLKFDNIN